MSRITGVTVALATAAAVLSGSTAGGAEPAAPPTAELPREITRGVELTLADGDLFQVWTSKDDRTVWSRRRDAAAGAWGSRQVLLREKDLSCGDVDARTSKGAVAVMAQCDPGSYAEDQAPTASRALWSADTVTWSTGELEGEAYEEPGISPDGSRAVWIESNGYLTWGPGGFSRHVLDDRDRAYAVTATIADDEQVSYIYGRHLDDSQCGLSVLTRTGDATPSRQDIPLADACQEEVALANVDANTVHYGTLAESGRRVVLSRVDSGSSWTVTAIAPSTAPGLQTGGNTTAYFTAPGLPLHAVSATPRGTFRAQAYDRVAQSWGPPTIVHRTGRRRCTWGDPWTEGSLGVLVVLVRCADRTTVLTTDGSGWAVLRMGRHPYGVSPDGRYVAVPGRHRTHVISPELGVVTLPAGVTGRCDIVVPDGPDAAVLLTATGRDRGWPTVLKESGRRGWRLLSRTKLPTPSPACVEATADNIELPYRFRVHSRYQGYAVRIVERGGRWRVVRSRF
jgi:hypothetical protein